MSMYRHSRRDFLRTSGTLPFTAALAGYAAPRGSAAASSVSSLMNLNDKMKRAREVALNILKPTPKQLEHGLELHASSLVIEPYGFAPRLAIDGDRIRHAMESGASNIEIQDMTEEMRMTRCVTDPEERREFTDAWRASGVTCIFQNAGEEGNDVRRLIKRLARFTYVTDMMRDFIFKAVTPDDIVEAWKQNRRCLYLSGNGVPMPMDWVSLEEELRYIRIFFQLGIRMMHLTYNRRNAIGDGCAEPANGGLSDFGRAVVAEMNRVGVIVDVAHAGWRTGLEAAQISERPIVASHTVCSSVHEHIRAKPDEVIKAIADKGGLIGICCIPRFLGGTGDISAMMDHIDYAVNLVGADHVAIATDLAYSSRNGDREWEKVPERGERRAHWEQLWPPDDFVSRPEMMQSMAWTNWPLFTVGLVQRGHSDEDIQKILGNNALRVARAVIS